MISNAQDIGFHEFRQVVQEIALRHVLREQHEEIAIDLDDQLESSYY